MTAVLVSVGLPFSVSAAEAITADYIEDEIVFEYTPPSSSSGIRRAVSSFRSQLTALGVTELTELESYEDTLSTLSASSEPTTYVAKISGDVIKTCREIKKLSGVSYAEPNYILETCGYSTPLEIKNNTKNYVNYEKWYRDTVMNVPAAWEKHQTSGEGVTIAVIDNGFNLSATDFPVNLWDDGNGNHGWNTASNSSDISPSLHTDGTELTDSVHGTNVAGIIGMASNGSNFLGAAFGAELMLIKVAESQYLSTDTKTKISSAAVASAVDYARVNHADVISMSLGVNNVYPMVIRTAVDKAFAKNICIFAAAGNNGLGTNTLLAYPAAASNVIGVMASSKTDHGILTDFSNFDEHNGQYYDIVAPGNEIVGCGLGTGKFSVMNGTSQATPLVAACAALYISVHKDETVDEIYNAILHSSTKTATSNSDTSPSENYSYSMLDAVELLDFESIKPNIEYNLLTTVIHDPGTDFLYGLEEGYLDIANYVTVEEGTGTSEFIPTANGNGTDSVLKVYTPKGEYFKTITVTIFGDVNGDSIADGMDAVIMNCMKAGMLDTSYCVEYAADVNFDGQLSNDDIETVINKAIGLDFISQIR